MATNIGTGCLAAVAFIAFLAIGLLIFGWVYDNVSTGRWLG